MPTPFPQWAPQPSSPTFSLRAHQLEDLNGKRKQKSGWETMQKFRNCWYTNRNEHREWTNLSNYFQLMVSTISIYFLNKFHNIPPQLTRRRRETSKLQKMKINIHMVLLFNQKQKTKFAIEKGTYHQPWRNAHVSQDWSKQEEEVQIIFTVLLLVCINLVSHTLTLNNCPFSIATSNWERIDQASWHIVRAIRVHTHGNPSPLQGSDRG